MKLSTSSTFDVSQVASTKSYQELEPFFDYINTFSTDVVQAFNKQITLTDNLNVSFQTLSLQHGVGVNIGKVTPVGVLIQSETPYIGYSLTTLADSTRMLYVFFKEAQNVLANSAIWQAGTITRYKVQDVAPFSVGDVIKVISFGTANNNGTFPIVEIDTTNKYLYLNNRKRTSATGDESKTSFVGDSLKTYTIRLGLINA